MPDDKLVVCAWCGRTIFVADAHATKRKGIRWSRKPIYYCKDFVTCHEVAGKERE